MSDTTPPIPPFNAHVGIRWVERGEGKAVVEITLEDHHTNRRGVAHGGVMTVLLDSALGQAVVAAIRPEEWCATTSLSVNFVRGPRVGDTVRGHGECVRRGKRIAFARGEARDQDGRLLATAQGTWHLWPTKPD